MMMAIFKLLVFFILFYTPNVTCHVVLPNNSKHDSINILEKMKSDQSAFCIFPSEELYNSQLLELCSIPVMLSNQTDIRKYLEYDLRPLLCVALYDVSFHLCKLSEIIPDLKSKVPQSETSFSLLIESLENDESHNSVMQFCSTIGHNGSLLSNNSIQFSETSLWISYFNNIMKNETNCAQICRPQGLSNKKVHPFCSFIIWTNNFYTEDVKYQLKTNPENIDENINKKETDLKGKDQFASEKQPNNENIPSSKTENFQTTVKDNVNVQNKENVVQSTLNNVKEDKKHESKPELSNNLATSSKQVMQEPVTPFVEVTTANNAKAAYANNKQSKTQIDQQNELKNISNIQSNLKPTPFGVISQPSNPLPKFPETEQKEIDKSNENEEEQARNDDEDLAVQGPEDDGEDYIRPKENTFKPEKEKEVKDDVMTVEDKFTDAEDSHFFTNFVTLTVLCIIVYLAFHNKKKLLALLVEGKRRGPTRRRPNTATYSKLDCNLEEAMVSNTTASVTHVLY